MSYVKSESELKLTVTLHALVDEAIQQRAAVVTEGGAPVAVDLKLVLCPGILQESKKNKKQRKILTICQLVKAYMHDVFRQNPLEVSTFLSVYMKNETGIKLNAMHFFFFFKPLESLFFDEIRLNLEEQNIYWLWNETEVRENLTELVVMVSWYAPYRLEIKLRLDPRC